MEAFPLPNQEATTVAKKLVDEIFLRFSAPEQLHFDQGRQFESQLITEVCKLLNINKTRTTPYHPQCDGLVERFNRTLLNMLPKIILLIGNIISVKSACPTIVASNLPLPFTSCLAVRHNYRLMCCMGPEKNPINIKGNRPDFCRPD